MITLNIWQLLAVLVITYLFGWGIGRTTGESRAWAKMDKQEDKPRDSLFRPMQQVIGNVQYRSEGSTILAVRTDVDDEKKRIRYQDFLMKTPGGRYFRQMHSIYGMEGIFPLTKEEAMRYFNTRSEQRVSFEEAFGEKLIDA